MAENDIHYMGLTQNGQNLGPKRGGILNVKGMVQEIEIDGMKINIRKVEKSLEKLADLMQKFCYKT